MKRNILTLLTILLLLNFKLLAQDSSNVNFWLNAGAGFSTIGAAGNINGNLSFSGLITTLRFGGYMKGIFGNSMNEIGILVGGIKKSKKYFLSIAAGLASTQIKKGGSLFSKPNIIDEFGFVTEAQMCWPFFDIFGLGLSVSGNINGTESAFGCSLNLFLGKLN